MLLGHGGVRAVRFAALRLRDREALPRTVRRTEREESEFQASFGERIRFPSSSSAISFLVTSPRILLTYVVFNVLSFTLFLLRV